MEEIIEFLVEFVVIVIFLVGISRLILQLYYEIRDEIKWRNS